jgi:hypothetical protein
MTQGRQCPDTPVPTPSFAKDGREVFFLFLISFAAPSLKHIKWEGLVCLVAMPCRFPRIQRGRLINTLGHSPRFDT